MQARAGEETMGKKVRPQKRREEKDKGKEKEEKRKKGGKEIGRAHV